MQFTKMHGIGNDYVFVNLLEESVAAPSELAVAVSRRHFGVGSDGLILIGPSEQGDVSMRIFNADGSEAEMCGNGVRCVAKYAYDHGLCTKQKMAIETLAGVRTVDLVVEGGQAVAATVNMGRPRLARSEIPMTGPETDRVVDEELELQDRTVSVTCVSMGNPHCIIPVEELDALPWREIGAEIENHTAFPERTNVHFVKVISPDEVRVATWERGSGATLACGTGASAVCVATNLLGMTERAVLGHLPGGDLQLTWSERDECVYMTGPAVEVFTGQWPE